MELLCLSLDVVGTPWLIGYLGFILIVTLGCKESCISYNFEPGGYGSRHYVAPYGLVRMLQIRFPVTDVDGILEKACIRFPDEPCLVEVAVEEKVKGLSMLTIGHCRKCDSTVVIRQMVGVIVSEDISQYCQLPGSSIPIPLGARFH